MSLNIKTCTQLLCQTFGYSCDLTRSIQILKAVNNKTFDAPSAIQQLSVKFGPEFVKELSVLDANKTERIGIVMNSGFSPTQKTIRVNALEDVHAQEVFQLVKAYTEKQMVMPFIQFLSALNQKTGQTLDVSDDVSME